MANMYKKVDGTAKVLPSYYERTIRMAVIIMCQQAARNYFLRIRADLVGKTVGGTNAKS